MIFQNVGYTVWGGIRAVHPQIRQAKKMVRRATVVVLKQSGFSEIKYFLRNVSKIAPI